MMIPKNRNLYLSVSVLKRSDSKWEKVGPTSGAF